MYHHQIHLNISSEAWDRLVAGTAEWPQPVSMNQIGRYALSELAAEYGTGDYDSRERTPLPGGTKHVQVRTTDAGEAGQWARLASELRCPKLDVLKLALERLMYHIG